MPEQDGEVCEAGLDLVLLLMSVITRLVAPRTFRVVAAIAVRLLVFEWDEKQGVQRQQPI